AWAVATLPHLFELIGREPERLRIDIDLTLVEDPEEVSLNIKRHGNEEHQRQDSCSPAGGRPGRPLETAELRESRPPRMLRIAGREPQQHCERDLYQNCGDIHPI